MEIEMAMRKGEPDFDSLWIPLPFSWVSFLTPSAPAQPKQCQQTNLLKAPRSTIPPTPLPPRVVHGGPLIEELSYTTVTLLPHVSLVYI